MHLRQSLFIPCGLAFLAFFPACKARQASTLASDVPSTSCLQPPRAQSMRQCVEASRNADELMAKIGGRCQILTFVKEAHNPQKQEIDAQNPGLICVLNDNLRLRMTTKPGGKYDGVVEMLVRSYGTDLVPVRATFAGDRGSFAVNPQTDSGERCSECHGTVGKLIWSQYVGPDFMNWAGVYGALDDKLNDSMSWAEFSGRFAKETRGRYKPAQATLKFLRDEYEAQSPPYLDAKVDSQFRSTYQFELRPNFQLTMLAAQTNGDAFARQLTASPLFSLLPSTTLFLSASQCWEGADAQMQQIKSLAKTLQLPEGAGALADKPADLLLRLHGLENDPFFTFDENTFFGTAKDERSEQINFMPLATRPSEFLAFNTGLPGPNGNIDVNDFVVSALLRDESVRKMLPPEASAAEIGGPIEMPYGNHGGVPTAAGYQKLCKSLGAAVDGELKKITDLMARDQSLRTRQALQAYALRGKGGESLKATVQACGSCHGREADETYASLADNQWWYELALERIRLIEMPPRDGSAETVHSIYDDKALEAVRNELKAVIASSKKTAPVEASSEDKPKTAIKPLTDLNPDSIAKLADDPSCAYVQRYGKAWVDYDYVYPSYYIKDGQSHTLPAEFGYGDCRFRFCTARVQCGSSYLPVICEAKGDGLCPSASECLRGFADGLKTRRYLSEENKESYERYLVTAYSRTFKVYPTADYVARCRKKSAIAPVGCVHTNVYVRDKGKTLPAGLDFAKDTSEGACVTVETPAEMEERSPKCLSLNDCESRIIDLMRTEPAKVE